jgi:hypothetical protein
VPLVVVLMVGAVGTRRQLVLVRLAALFRSICLVVCDLHRGLVQCFAASANRFEATSTEPQLFEADRGARCVSTKGDEADNTGIALDFLFDSKWRPEKVLPA